MTDFNPQETMPDLLFNATNDIAQVPVAGITRLGHLAARTNSWDACVSFELEGPALEALVERTKARHEELGITRSGNLDVTVPYTWDLVRSGLVAVVARVYPGQNRRSISPANKLDIITGSALMRNGQNRGLFGKLFEAADSVLTSPEVREYIGIFGKGGFPKGSYSHRLLEISRQYADDPENRRKHLERARDDLTNFVRPEMTDRLRAVQNIPPGWDVKRIAHHLTLCKPSKAMERKHFGQPK